MQFTFDAVSVSCDEAIDGEILKVMFDSDAAADDLADRTSPYLLISRGFEFPGPATFECFDGVDYHGGIDLTSVALSRTRISVRLARASEIDVTFRVPEKEFVQLATYLAKMIDGRIYRVT